MNCILNGIASCNLIFYLSDYVYGCCYIYSNQTRDFLACEQQTYFWERSDDRKYVCCSQATHLLLLHTNVMDKNKLEDRQEAVLKIKCCDC